MSVLHRLPMAAAVALTLAATAPAHAQEPPGQPPFQGHRPYPGQRPQPGPRPFAAPRPPGPFRGGPAPRPQEAQRHHGGNGAAIAAGVIGGLAAGALLGGALSGGPVAPVETGPGPEPGYGARCPLVSRPVYDGSGQFAGYQTVPSC